MVRKAVDAVLKIFVVQYTSGRVAQLKTEMQYNLCETATLKKDQNMVFKTDYGLMQVKSIAECSKGSVLQYF